MGEENITIDPWGSAQSTDYDRIIEQFGLSPMTGVEMANPTKLYRRGIVFAHRDMEPFRRLSGPAVLSAC